MAKQVRYTLSEAGRELKPILLALGTWGQRWARTQYEGRDLDSSMLMWDIHRTMDTAYFHAGRTVLLFEFNDYTSKFRRWWLVVDKSQVDVCMKDPGFDIDLHILTDVKTLTRIWLGEMPYPQAIRTKKLILFGPLKLKRDISKWLGTNYFADTVYSQTKLD